MFVPGIAVLLQAVAVFDRHGWGIDMGFRHGRRIAMVLVIVLPALLACTDDDMIGVSTGLLGLTLQSVGGSGRYDVSVLQIAGRRTYDAR